MFGSGTPLPANVDVVNSNVGFNMFSHSKLIQIFEIYAMNITFFT